MSLAPGSSPTSSNERRGSTSSPRSNKTFKNNSNVEENVVPVTEVFYNSHLHPVTFIRVFVFLTTLVYFFLVFMSKNTNNLTSPFYISFNNFHNKVIEFYMVVLDLYKRCPAITGTIKKLRFELPYFMKMFSLYLPKYEKKIMYLTNFNTLNNWISLFVALTFAFLMELLSTVINNMLLTYKSRNSLRYCTNMVHISKFHDKTFTQEQVNKLLLSKEYVNLKNSRHGLGPEAWNWQLRKTLKRTTEQFKSQDSEDYEDDIEYNT